MPINGEFLYGANSKGWHKWVRSVDCELIKKGKDMSKPALHVLDNSIVLNWPGRTEVISKSDKRFDKVLDLIREGAEDEIKDFIDSVENAFDGTGLDFRDGKLWDGTKPLPETLTARIIKFRNMELPYKPLLNFWENLKLNPSFNSREMLYKFLKHNGHPITEDGMFIAYRGVSEDFKDKHTGQFDNRPGQVLEMPRDQVDDNPNNTCSSGFHVACFDYARGFGDKLIEVKVNPRDVVTVPTDYEGTKMRVCRFEVIQEAEKPRTEEVYNNPDSIYDEDLGEYGDDSEDEMDDDHCSECGHEKDPWENFCPKCGYEH